MSPGICIKDIFGFFKTSHQTGLRAQERHKKLIQSKNRYQDMNTQIKLLEMQKKKTLC